MILTIIIPTYNRVNDLERLLATLEKQSREKTGRFKIIVGDNASTDDTPQTVEAYSQSISAINYLRHEKNLGPDENFARCIDLVDTPYFWLIGDDDLPRPGAISLLLDVLEQQRPDAVYINSKWLAPPISTAAATEIGMPAIFSMSRHEFAKITNVWTTFISGWVVEKKYADSNSTRKHTNTNLIQLGWVLSAIRNGEKFAYVKTQMVLATAGNSGGYSVMRVFGHNFPKIVRAELDSSDSAAMLTRHSIDFLSRLIIGQRRSRIGNFAAGEVVAETFSAELGSSLIFRTILRPIAEMPMPVAVLFSFIARGISKILTISDWKYGKMRGKIRRAKELEKS